MKILGIIGAGKLGTTLARLLENTEYSILTTNSGDHKRIRLTMSVLAPHAEVVSLETLAKRSDIVVLALPLSRFSQIPRDAFAGKIVIDAMNHWYEIDGPRSDTLSDSMSSSEAVQQYFTGAHVVKALSHIGYHELHDFAHTQPPRAMAIAGNDKMVKTEVAKLIQTIGFDVLDIGDIQNGRVLEPGHPGFGANRTKQELMKLLA